jgi:hypothetical protein
MKKKKAYSSMEQSGRLIDLLRILSRKSEMAQMNEKRKGKNDEQKRNDEEKEQTFSSQMVKAYSGNDPCAPIKMIKTETMMR